MRRYRSFCLTSALTLALTSASHADELALDPAFGAGGLVTVDPAGTAEFYLDSRIESDGSMILALGFFDVLTPVRLLPDGQVDPGYGDGSWIDLRRRPSATAFRPTGEFLTAGNFLGDSFFTQIGSDGLLDPSFGTNGEVFLDLGLGPQTGQAVTAVEPMDDGRLLVAGFSQETEYRLFVARLLADGSLDTSFQGTGLVQLDVVEPGTLVDRVMIDSEGKIHLLTHLAPPSGPDPHVLRRHRLLADGTLDTTFGAQGANDFLVFEPFEVIDAALDAGNRMRVLYSTAPGATELAAFAVDGGRDETFRNLTLPLDAFEIGRRADGSWLVTGTATDPNGLTDNAVMLISATGHVDTGFGDGGIAFLPGPYLDAHVRVSGDQLIAAGSNHVVDDVTLKRVNVTLGQISLIGEGVANADLTMPSIDARGTLCAGDPVQVELGNVAPDATGFLLAGASYLGVPFAGGTLIPSPSVLFPVAMPTSSLSGNFPPGAAGATFYLQAWWIDGAGPGQFSATPGVELIAP